jgi:hypothetical protein
MRDEPATRRRWPLSSWAAVTAVGVLGVIALAGIVLTSSSPSPSPRPVGTPVAGAWTGLDWSNAAKVPADTMILDVTAWQGEYIGVGVYQKPDAEFGEPTFLTSRDGLDWTVAYQYNPQLNQFPAYLVPLGKGLLAVSNQGVLIGGCCSGPSLWQSDDGTTWYGIPPLGDWDSVWINHVALMGVASTADGVVVLGMDGNLAPVVLHSTDGRHWSRLGLPASFDHAVPTRITAYPGGFVITGRVGDPDGMSASGQLVYGLARPAAWWSADGVTWQAADVEGTVVHGGELSQVAVGAGGLYAVGVDTEPGQPGNRGPQSGWASADGKTWRQAGQVAQNAPPDAGLAGDGTHLVLLGQDPDTIGPVLAAWASTDGTTWTRLAFTGATATLPTTRDVFGYGRGLWVAPNGIVVLAGTPTQEAWYATATGH